MRSRTYGPEPVGISRAFAAEVTAESVMAQQASFAVEQVPYNRYEDLGILAARSPCGRLTVVSGDPVGDTGVVATNCSTIYFTPYLGNFIPIFDGTTFGSNFFSEVALALASNSGYTQYHQSDKLFDVFAYIDANGAVAIGTGPQWSSSSSRGTGAGTTELQYLAGILVNANSIQLRFGSGASDLITIDQFQATYVGTFLCSSNGNTRDFVAQRLLSNAYNKIPRVIDATVNFGANYNYSTATWRPFNNNSSIAVIVVRGLDIEPLDLFCSHVARNNSGPANARVGIGINTTSASTAWMNTPTVIQDFLCLLTSRYSGGRPGLGKHVITPLEIGAGSGTQTWVGAAINGLTGTHWA